MKKFRIRDLFLKYPLLDAIRVRGLAWIFKHGISVYDRSYRVMSVIPQSASDYVKTAASGSGKDKMELVKPAIYAYFHGQMYILLHLTPRYKMTAIASNSRDGEMIARAGEEMGYQVARGSRTEGGVKGALHLISAADNRQSLLFPVDGPRGPNEKVKGEILRIAQLTGLPIIPVLGRARTQMKAKTWDSYNCPVLNTAMVLVFGEPVFVDKELDKEQKESLRLELETYMSELKAKADQFYDVTTT